MRRTAPLIFLALCLAAPAAAAAAAARKRNVVVVLRLAGGADGVQRAVTQVVARGAIAISDAVWRGAERRLQVGLGDEREPETVARLCASVHADGVLSGSLRRTGRSWSLSLTLRNGKTGVAGEELVVPLADLHGDARARRAIAARLEPALAALDGTSPPSAPPALPPPEAPEPPAPAALVSPPQPPEAPSVPAAPDRAPPPPPSSQSASQVGLDVDVGFGVFTRTLSFTSSDSLASAQRPHGYAGGAAPSVVAGGEIFPFAIAGSRSVWAGLGVAFSFERALMVKANFAATEHSGAQTHLGAGLRWRFRFADEPGSPTFELLGGWNRFDFTLDPGMTDAGVPNVSYSYLDVGVAGRIPLGTRFAVRASARYLHVLDAGAIDAGDSYGGAAVLGIDADVGIELHIGAGGYVGVGAHLQRFMFAFDGTGAFASNRDGEPATQDVTGAVDQYLGGYVRTGWMF